MKITEYRDIILNVFESNAKDIYDVDMFIHDIEEAIKKTKVDDPECLVNFECAVIDAIREIDIYEWYGSAGCIILVSELFNWAQIEM